MAQATFYTHAKRHNSTSVPSGGSAYDVDLKGGADLIDPVFTMQFSGTPQFSMMNYEGRYYFITGIRSIRQDLWEISGHVDVLATYKSNVQSTSAYVLYHTHNNTELADRRLGIETTKTVDVEQGAFDSFGSVSPSTCAVIINVVGEDSCAAYAVTQAEADGLLNHFENWFNNTAFQATPPPQGNPFATVEEALTYLADFTFLGTKQLMATGKASDSIKNAYMIPFSKSNIPGTSSQIKLGKYVTNVTGNKIGDRTIGDDASVTIPWQATDWRRNAPYHEIFLYLPFIGLVNISPSDVIGASYLYVHVELDVLSGDAIFTVSADDTKQVIAQYNTNIAAPYAIGAANINPTTASTALISGAAAVGALLTGNPATGVALATSGIIGIANALEAQPTCIGANAGGAAVGLADRAKVICYTIFHDTVEDPGSVSTAIGTPTNCVQSLGSISGYVQTRAASVSGSMTDTERNEVNNLLDGGVYIE